jgi:hypothetical protein
MTPPSKKKPFPCKDTIDRGEPIVAQYDEDGRLTALFFLTPDPAHHSPQE